MADIDFDSFDDGPAGDPPQRGARATRLLHLTGAALSLALMVGAVWWGYMLAVRDVTGVPVMRAIEGAMRVAPADPGGNVAGHQGLSVNAVAAAGTAAPLPESLSLAPAAERLSEEDAAGLVQPVLAGAAPGLQGSSLFPQSSGQQPAPLAAAEIPTSDQEAVAAALAEALGGAAADTGAEIGADTGAETGGAAIVLARSLRPLARPAGLAAQTDVAPTLASASATEVDGASIAPGASLVQLGAFDDDTTARSDWTRLNTRFPELMDGKSMVIQTAESGGRTFYRLRAFGFADADEARRFCTALLAENASCVPVTQR